MNRIVCRAILFTIVLFAVVVPVRAAPPNWPQFRGPGSRGIADNKLLPDHWSDTENVAWKTNIPGRGWSSPIVWEKRVFLTTVINTGTAEEPKKGLYFGGNRPTPPDAVHQWKLYCLDLESGQVVWERQVHEGKPESAIHLKNSFASETPVTDGTRVYCCFGNVGVFCFDFAGNEVWRYKLDPHKTRFGWGTAASPVLDEGRLYLVNDNDEESYLLALDALTGQELWRVPRDEKSNWATPFVWRNERRTEIVTPGTGMVRSYDLEGKLLWSLKGMSSITIATPYEHEGLLYVSSGYIMDSTKPIYAIRPGGEGDISLKDGEKSNAWIAWCQEKGGPYNPSTLLYDNRLYVLYDRGLFACFNPRDGAEIYSAQRIPEGRSFTSSPWAYDGKIFCLNEDGMTFVIRAGDKFELLHTNPLAADDMCMATPAIAGDRLLLRTSARLYCIQAKSKTGKVDGAAHRNESVVAAIHPKRVIDGSSFTAMIPEVEPVLLEVPVIASKSLAAPIQLAQAAKERDTKERDTQKKGSRKNTESSTKETDKKERTGTNEKSTSKPAPGKVVKLREPFAGVAFDYVSGDLAVTSTQGHLFVYRAKFFGGSTSAVDGPLDVDANSPVAFRAYGEHMLLLASTSNQLAVFDAKSLKPFDSKGVFPAVINLPDPTPGKPGPEPIVAIATSRLADDPVAYVGLGNPTSGCFINLGAGGIAARIGVGSHSGPCVMSPSGRLMKNLVGDIALRMPAEFSVFATLPSLADQRLGPSSLVMDPFDQYSINAKSIVRLGSNEEVGTFQGRAICALLNRPYFVIADQSQLSFIKRESAESVVDVSIPESLQAVAGSKSELTAFDDSQSDRLIALRDDSIWLLPLATLKLPNTPYLAGRISLPTVVTPGEPLTLPVRVFDKRVKVSLEKGPESASLTNGQLTWTPDWTSAGIENVVFKYEADGAKSVQYFPTVVTNRGIPLKVAAGSAALSDDGRYVAVWNISQRIQQMEPNTIPKLCTVDLQEQRMLAERSFPQGIVGVAITSEQVFVRSGETRLEVFRVADLAPVRTLALSFTKANIQAFRNRVLVLQGMRRTALQLPDLSEVNSLVHSLQGEIHPSPGGWAVGPALLDSELKSVRFFHGLRQSESGLFSIGQDRDVSQGIKPLTQRWRTGMVQVGSNDYHTLPFNEFYTATAMMKEEGPSVSGVAPTSISIEFSRYKSDDPRTRANPLEVPERVPLYWGPSSIHRWDATIISANDSIVVLANGQLLPLRVSEVFPAATQNVPLVVRPIQPATTLATDGKTKLQFAAKGGKPPYTFECELLSWTAKEEVAKLVQKGTAPGEFLLDGAGLTKEILADRPGQMNIFRNVGMNSEDSSEQIIDQIAKRGSKYLQPLLNQTLDGLPAVAHCTGIVTDSAGKKAAVTYQLVLDLPRRESVASLERTRKEDAIRETERRRAIELANQQRGRNAQVSPPPPSRKQTPVETFVADFSGRDRRPITPSYWPEKNLAIAVSNAVRKTWPLAEPPDKRFERLAIQFSVAMDPQLTNLSTPRNAQRDWKLADGSQLRGLMTGFGPAGAWINSANNNRYVGLNDLSDESFQQAYQLALELHQGERNLSAIGRALGQFNDLYGCYPTQTFVDQDGKPLLSWRVLLLPYLGYTPLFRLFHLDESWDSPHNRQLIAHMPMVYAPRDLTLPPGKSGVLAITGPRAAFRSDAPTLTDEIRDGIESTLFVVEVSPEHAVEWTKPSDLEFAGDLAVLTKLHRRKRVTGQNPRTPGADAKPDATEVSNEDGVFDVLFGTFPRSISAKAPRDQLLLALQIDDGKPNQSLFQP